MIRPLDLTSKLLFKHWKLGAEEEEFTVMRVEVEGIEQGDKKCYSYFLYDEFDEQSKTSSMARTTGYTCTAIASLILNGDYQRRGVSPAEFVGSEPQCFEKVLDYLKARNIRYHLTMK